MARLSYSTGNMHRCSWMATSCVSTNSITYVRPWIQFPFSLASLLLHYRLGYFSQDSIHCIFALLDAGNSYNVPYILCSMIIKKKKSTGNSVTHSSLWKSCQAQAEKHLIQSFCCCFLFVCFLFLSHHQDKSFCSDYPTKPYRCWGFSACLLKATSPCEFLALLPLSYSEVFLLHWKCWVGWNTQGSPGDPRLSSTAYHLNEVLLFKFQSPCSPWVLASSPRCRESRTPFLYHSLSTL